MSRMPSTSREIPLSVLLLLVLPLFLSFSLEVINSQSDENREQKILLKIKNEWGNPPAIELWDPLFGSHCNWPGIACTDGFVTGVLLSETNIATEIPPSICELERLTDINLSNNFIPGEFPTLLYNCPNLQTLDLSQNNFVGPIPSNIDRLSSTLQYLNLGANNFSGDIPAAIGRFPVLNTLSLLQNQFNGSFPPEIGNLTNLEVLELAFNRFIPSRLPSEFGRLKKLRYVWMSKTNLIGEIPESIGDCSSLEYLDLSTNGLNGTIPSSLFQLKNLAELYLWQNRLSGEIPRKIETLNLIDIDLSMNSLIGTIPEDFGKLRYLSTLDMYANRLNGVIPASIGRIPALTSTRLFKNNLSGVLPPELGLYSKLKAVEVSDNRLSGNLPESLCANGVLTGLIAFSNNLSGTLPKSLAKCDSLTMVQLHNNSLSGEVPYGFWSLKDLSTLIIRDNLFSGELPDELGLSLERLEIGNNRFSGGIPTKIAASAASLSEFIASNNMFSGEIPVGLTALSRLLSLSLDRNRLTGQIPVEIISWRSLSFLNLSRNQLSGELPPAFGSLPDLTQLDLSENQLVGGIPSELGNLRLTVLNLSSNRLTGKIPPRFENLAYDRSFMNNSGLCAGSPNLSLGSCISEPRGSRKLSSRLLAMILVPAGVIFIAVVLLALFVIRDFRRKKHRKDLTTWKLTSFQRLDFTEVNILSSLTENNLIGSGGSGKVYRVAVNASGYVAVKRIWNRGKLEQKLEKEFLTEVQILGMIRHSNIVKLLCCISSDNSKILVYEYMENGSLDQWLHNIKQETPGMIRRNGLDWPKRLQIAIGAAQGLSYLHHNCSPPIVHRDVKSSNILLDSEFKARIADFGLAKMLVKHGEPNTASVIAGSFGYIAPEYGHTTKINEKIDVYSFGVVLLELATGRQPNDGDEHTCLAEWAWRQYQEDKPLIDALDEDIKETGYLDEMMMVFKLGLICTSTLPSTRPTMKEIVHILLRRDPLRSYKQNKTVTNEYDAAPLLNDPTSRLTSYKGSQRMKSSSDVEDDEDDDDDDENFACNV